jgi:hypothetical protein
MSLFVALLIHQHAKDREKSLLHFWPAACTWPLLTASNTHVDLRQTGSRGSHIWDQDWDKVRQGALGVLILEGEYQVLHCVGSCWLGNSSSEGVRRGCWRTVNCGNWAPETNLKRNGNYIGRSKRTLDTGEDVLLGPTVGIKPSQNALCQQLGSFQGDKRERPHGVTQFH